MYREVSNYRQRIEEQVRITTFEDQEDNEVSAHPRQCETLGKLATKEVRIVDLVGDQGPPRAITHVVEPINEFMLNKPA